MKLLLGITVTSPSTYTLNEGRRNRRVQKPIFGRCKPESYRGYGFLAAA